MRPNKIKRALQRGETVFGTMIGDIRMPAIGNILAEVGFDFVFIDMEHGPYDIEDVDTLCRVARLAGIVPLVRVPDTEYFLMSRPLDAGAQGLMIPRVRSRDQVEFIVRSAKYPPTGERGCSLLKGHSDYHAEPVKDFVRQANEENMVILQIELKEAVEHIDELLSVPGVDVALIGPNDLSLSLGIPDEFSNPLLEASIQKVVDSCQRHGVVAGIHIANTDILRRWMRKGMRMITWSSPLHMMMSAARAGLQTLRQPL